MSKAFEEYSHLRSKRLNIVDRNNSRRMMNPPLPQLAVPPKPVCPKVMVAYRKEGRKHLYIGVIEALDECPEGCFVKMEDAIR